MTFNPRREAVSQARGDQYPVVMALVHVGDQLEALGELLKAVQENLSMPPYPHYVAVEVRTTEAGSDFVPGELRGVR